MQAVFTGFDSAWGAENTGAICDLVLLEDGSLHLTSEPARANWASALVRARQDIHADLHVWAIDQPLLVLSWRIFTAARTRPISACPLDASA
jgi:predicted RNase H-like nuclease